MISNAKFLSSATSTANAPEFAHSEVAFLGRSNVGKSSLINALTNQKQLAKSSATPGKTRLINFFEVEFKVNLNENLGENSTSLNLNSNSQENSSKNSVSCLNLNENSAKNPENSTPERFKLIFVDLPGFGYAKISRTQRQEWDKNLNEFLKQRTSLKLLVHLRDARHENLQIDEQINAYLQGILQPSQALIAVFTKADKLNQSQKARLLKAYPNALLVSSAKKTGLERLETALVSHALGLESAPTKSSLAKCTLGLKNSPTKSTLGLKNEPTKTTPTKHELKLENSLIAHKIGL